MSPSQPTFNLADEYHTGEYVLPYWALKTYGLIPYVNHHRGWINLLNGLIAEQSFKGTYASYPFTDFVVAFFILTLLFVTLKALVGAWPALFHNLPCFTAGRCFSH